MNKKTLSIIAPCYNEEANILDFYTAILKVMNEIPLYNFELICIDDGSTDSSLQKLLELHEKDPRVHVVEFSRNFGKEAALTAGIDMAKGDAVIPIDIDLQDPPILIFQFLRLWEKGAEVVLAKRVNRDSDSFLKRKSAELFYAFHNCLSKIKIPANAGDYRLMDRQVVDVIKTLPEKQRFMKGLFTWAGFKTEVVDYIREPRHAGEGKFSGWKLWNFALEGISSFSAIPLTFWFYFGLATVFCAMIFAFSIILKTFIYGIESPGYASIMVTIIFFGGLQFIGIGLLGEYIGRIYMETKNRPIYIIKKHHVKQ